jgi:alcohol dehydrogenase (NADP+)
MTPTEEQFEGWCGLGPESAKGKMVWQGYEPKPFEESDIDIEVRHIRVPSPLNMAC